MSVPGWLSVPSEDALLRAAGPCLLRQLHAAPYPPPFPQCPCPVPSSVRSWDLRGHLIHMELIHSHLNHLHEPP